MPNGDNNMEGIVKQVIKCLEEGKTDQYDAMLILSLVNLIGITKVIESKRKSGSGSPAGEEENQLMGMLLNTLAEKGKRGGHGGFDPAILLSLLGTQGKRPENALLMSLLSRIMQPPAQPNPSSKEDKSKMAGNETKEGKPKTAGTDKKESKPEPAGTGGSEGQEKKIPVAAEKKMKNPKQQDPTPAPVRKEESKGNVISWDRRLG